ncbi:MAG: sulfotransferase [Hyphomonadaceae bacterium]|nr:sulfotransferase [Hyphomonadaceae bacterium]
MLTARLLQEGIAALSANDPARAVVALRALLDAEPANGDAKLVLSEALRRLGRLKEARDLALQDAQARPGWFGAHRQLGVIMGELGEPVAASAALEHAAQLNALHPTIWRELGDQLTLVGDVTGAQEAYARHAVIPPVDARLVQAAEALRVNEHAKALPLIEAFLQEFPADISALRMRAEAHARADRPVLAEKDLRRCLELAPRYGIARHGLGQLLMGLGRLEEAREQASILLRQDPDNRGSKRLLAAVLNGLGEYNEAARLYESVLDSDPTNARSWMSLGHVLKTVGRTDEGIAAYRRSLALAPNLGESWWSLANLKTVSFSDEDIARMRSALSGGDLSTTDRINMSFALGKALEGRHDYVEAFARYSAGAALQRRETPYDADRLTSFVQQSVSSLTREFFEERKGCGETAADPIFVVGLPRAGSTLVEQILASHSAVEGTMELPDLQAISQSLATDSEFSSYIPVLKTLEREALAALGARYLQTTRVQRKLGRPFFIDKMPNNFQHVGLLHLILPNAKIIDARRHPMACGWSCFKQHFALGQSFSYDLADIGRYYADYVRLMAHYDDVLPGRVHRVVHEALVADPETHIRALLDYCDLPFEEACLRPHETARAIKTASSEQVRRPISAAGLDDWRAFEQWLTPLRDALGPVLDAYPNAPA